jgi:hypothetical protein
VPEVSERRWFWFFELGTSFGTFGTVEGRTKRGHDLSVPKRSVFGTMRNFGEKVNEPYSLVSKRLLIYQKMSPFSVPLGLFVL